MAFYTPRRALCLDLDGTVRRSRSGAQFGPTSPEDVELYPGVEETIWRWREAGFYVLGVTNQGVVGYGTRTELEVEAITAATCAAFEHDPFHAIHACYALPPGAGGKVEGYAYRSLLRKPGDGMLVQAELEARDAGFLIDWDRSRFVGDRLEDLGCARAAGVPFTWAWDFFGRPRPADAPVEPAADATAGRARALLADRAALVALAAGGRTSLDGAYAVLRVLTQGEEPQGRAPHPESLPLRNAPIIAGE